MDYIRNMPSKNIQREDIPGGFYHVYGRGAARRLIFVHDEDRQYFIELLRRYLGPEEMYDINNNPYPSYRGEVQLMAFCLMGTHFHMLLYQAESGRIAEFMKSLISSYTRYYNRKHASYGALLESRYRAVLIQNENYLVHLTRYIHFNPDDYESYEWSSLRYYLGEPDPDWLSAAELIEIANLSPSYYHALMQDYEDFAATLSMLNLADSGESLKEKEERTPF